MYKTISFRYESVIQKNFARLRRANFFLTPHSQIRSYGLVCVYVSDTDLHHMCIQIFIMSLSPYSSNEQYRNEKGHALFVIKSYCMKQEPPTSLNQISRAYRTSLGSFVYRRQWMPTPSQTYHKCILKWFHSSRLKITN